MLYRNCAADWYLICVKYIFRYGLVTDTQVSQSDVVELESKYNVSVLRIRHQKGLNRQGANSTNNVPPQSPLSTVTSNENALILNLICDCLYNHSISQNDRQINPVLI